MEIRKLILFCLLAQGCLSLYAQKAEIYTTSEKVKWQKTAIDIQKQDNPEADVIISKSKEQVIDGFGGTFSELGWDALSLLSEEQRNSVLRELFGPDGMRYTICRIPLGANDFARDWYSLNECPGDFEMKNFSLERDKQAMIPYVKAALSFNPKLKLWASPWSPPVWMKRTKHYATSPGDHNDFTEKNQVEGDHFIQEPKYLAAYALYLSKFIDAYKKNKIDISMLQFQNEPYTKHQWPNCLWTPKSMAHFIGKYLGPAFSKKHPDVDLWFGTFNCNKMEDLDCVMQNPDASKYLRGIGIQWEGKDIVADIYRKYPAMKLMQTENECGGGTIDWAAAEHTFDLVETYLNGGVNSYMYFNMVLQDEGISSWGWKQNSLIRVDSRTKEVLYTPEFYLMKHLSHFVKVGAHRLKVLKGDDVLAFQNPDGQIIILCVNKDTKERAVRLACEGSTINIKLASKTFNTIVI